MKKILSFILVLTLIAVMAVTVSAENDADVNIDAEGPEIDVAYANGVANANGAYNDMLSAFNGTYPDEYAGAYINTDLKLCVLLTERCADTDEKLAEAQNKMLSHVSDEHKGAVVFDTAAYSYNELLRIRDDIIAKLDAAKIEFSTAGIDEENNTVHTGILPEDYQKAIDFIDASPELSELPIRLTEQEKVILTADGETMADDENTILMPVTGDNSNTGLWIALLIISGIALVVIIVIALINRKK